MALQYLSLSLGTALARDFCETLPLIMTTPMPPTPAAFDKDTLGYCIIGCPLRFNLTLVGQYHCHVDLSPQKLEGAQIAAFLSDGNHPLETSLAFDVYFS